MRATALMLLCVVLAGQPRTKAKLPPLRPGEEALVRVVGDEVRLNPQLERVGVVVSRGLFLCEAVDDDMPDREFERIRAIQHRYRKAIIEGDREGFDGLCDRQLVLPVLAGTRVRVLRDGGPVKTVLEIPCDRRGARDVRILEGPAKGRVVSIPARNLVPPEAPSPKSKVSTPRR